MGQPWALWPLTFAVWLSGCEQGQAPQSAQQTSKPATLSASTSADYEPMLAKIKKEADERRAKAPHYNAFQLAMIYEGNMIAGDRTFKDQFFHLQGIVAQVTRTKDGDPALGLIDHHQIPSVIAVLLRGYEARAAEIRPWQQVSLYCEGRGMFEGRFPWMVCGFDDAPEPAAATTSQPPIREVPAPAVTPEPSPSQATNEPPTEPRVEQASAPAGAIDTRTLYAEYQRDYAAADAAHAGKSVVVTGVVMSTMAADAGVTTIRTVVLEGGLDRSPTDGVTLSFANACHSARTATLSVDQVRAMQRGQTISASCVAEPARFFGTTPNPNLMRLCLSQCELR